MTRPSAAPVEQPQRILAFETEARPWRAALAAVLPARCRDDFRWALKAVLVTVSAKQVKLEVTDGHRLHRCVFALQSDAWVVPGEYRLGNGRALRLLKRAQLRKPKAVLKVFLRPGDLQLPGGSASRLASLGKPRDPAIHDGESLWNPEYLADAARAAHSVGVGHLKMETFAWSDPIVLTGVNRVDCIEFSAIVMPMRRDDQSFPKKEAPKP